MQYATNAKRQSFPTDDDAAPTTRLGAGRRATGSQRLRHLRACDSLWIFAGNLHHNRGIHNPGDQLMMSPMTRVFFGFPAEDRTTNSAIGFVTIRRQGTEKDGCSLRFSDNSMDVLTLPVPGTAPWPPQYDRECLLFRRILQKGRVKFQLELGGAPEIKKWKASSAANGSSYTMTSGREWGVF